MFKGKYQRSEACAIQAVKNGGYDKAAMLFVQGEDGADHLYSLTLAQVEELYKSSQKVLEKTDVRWK